VDQESAAVVVVGSVNVDMIIRSERLPRPGETIVGGEFVEAGGGKGANQALAAHRLGADVRFIARVGRDGPGETSRRRFRDEGLRTTWISEDPAAPTGVALILVDAGGQNLISVASGANLRLSPDDVRDARTAFEGARVLLVQLEIPIETVEAALTTARTLGVTTLLNPAPARPIPDALLRMVGWLTPNEIEAATLSGLNVVDGPSAARAAAALVDRGASNVVVTLGSHGAVWATRAGVEPVPALPVDSVDTTAAGDAFSAALAVALARGESPRRALRYASAAGALATTRLGAQPSLPTRAEIEKLLATIDDPMSAR
jgi:ribokinase